MCRENKEAARESEKFAPASRLSPWESWHLRSK
nr:MAG TPA: hypothetical protein [Caudoviricetes sp.]